MWKGLRSMLKRGPRAGHPGGDGRGFVNAPTGSAKNMTPNLLVATSKGPPGTRRSAASATNTTLPAPASSARVARDAPMRRDVDTDHAARRPYVREFDRASAAAGADIDDDSRGCKASASSNIGVGRGQRFALEPRRQPHVVVPAAAFLTFPESDDDGDVAMCLTLRNRGLATFADMSVRLVPHEARVRAGRRSVSRRPR